MKKLEFQSNIYLIVAAMIWGFAFVAQRVGAEYVPTFTFDALRFAIGSLSLIPLILFLGNKERKKSVDSRKIWLATLPGGLIAGVVLFAAISMQQSGMIDTTAGKAGFITDLYIVIVPLLGLFLRHRVHALTWVSIAICVVGLYLISVTQSFTTARGDLFELGGALLWAFHILIIDHFAKKTDVLKLSLIQFTVCSVLSMIVGLSFEQTTIHNISLAAIPLLYGGVCSVGVAYTFQTLGQRHSKPSHSAIILSLESVFSCIGGAMILGENLGLRGYLGCLLMITGMFLSQIGRINFKAIKSVINRLPMHRPAE